MRRPQNGESGDGGQTTAKRGRPRVQVNVKLVEKLAEKGCTKAEIAQVVGCHEDTLTANFSAFFDKGRMKLKISLREKQIRVALKGNVALLVWLGKAYLGQTDKQEVTQQQALRTYGPDAMKRLRAALREFNVATDGADGEPDKAG